MYSRVSGEHLRESQRGFIRLLTAFLLRIRAFATDYDASQAFETCSLSY